MQIYNADCISHMNSMPEKSIDVIITSPPYFQQRDYGCDHQIGRETEVEEYIQVMGKWAESCFRVLKDTGSLFLNIGDKYENKGF